MATILLTNDDGIEAEGLRVLEESLDGLGDIVVVAPDRERSAVSHGLTIRSPLEARQLAANRYALNGTPADCIIHAVKRVLAARPDLVISGINRGANLGDDIMYSGTVAAAREASHRGIAALAVSQAYDDRPVSFDRGAKFIRTLAGTMLELKSDGGLCLNVNVPVREIRGVKVTRQGCAPHYPHFNSLDRNGDAGNGAGPSSDGDHRSDIPPDFQAILEGFISITPLQRDQTDYGTADSLLRDAPRLFRLPEMG